jgi:serine/threonine protein kinase
MGGAGRFISTFFTVRPPCANFCLSVLRHRRYSPASDVWSAATATWELLSGGKEPFLGLSEHEAREIVLRGEAQKLFALPSASASEDIEFFERAVRPCFATDPTRRPSASRLVTLLDSQFLRAEAGPTPTMSMTVSPAGTPSSYVSYEG